MRFLTATFVILLLAIQQVYPICFDGSQPEERDLDQCYWYNDETCCTASNVPDDFSELSADAPCGEIPEGCLDQLQLLVCSICSPDLLDAVTINGIDATIRICKGFADKIYNSCKKAPAPDENGNCQTFEDNFPDSEAFWNSEAFGSIFAYYDGDEDCFNAGAIATPLAFLATAALALFVL